MDLSLARAAWTVLDAVLYEPVPAILPNLGLVLMYVVYHAGSWTPGHRMFGLQLVNHDGSGEPSRRARLLRSMILAILVLLDWERWVTAIAPAAPRYVELVVEIARWSVLLTSALLARMDPQGLTLHDRASGTRMVRTGESPRGIIVRPIPKWMPVLSLGTTTVIAIAMVLGAGAIGGAEVARDWLTRSPLENDAMARDIETAIAEELGLRSNVTCSRQFTGDAANGDIQNLNVEVELPLLGWLSQERERIPTAVLPCLPIAQYPRMAPRISITTWFTFFTMNRQIELTPEEMRQALREIEAFRSSSPPAAPPG